MMEVTTNQSIAEIGKMYPATLRVLESFGLDYCCGGRYPLGKACEEAGIDPQVVLDALLAIEKGPEPDWASMGLVELVDQIEATHHAYLHTELGRLGVLAEKVTLKHVARHPELEEVRSTLAKLSGDLTPHLAKEERVLFPMIRELATAPTAPTFHCGSLKNPISVMMLEHDGVGELLEQLRTLTSGYQTPANGCTSYRALYDCLAELEADTHLHVHKENNLLFPAVIALEESWSTIG
ncbi:MAG: iron-sulfur cluster repair di-iron protein [Ferrimicrobium sp.]